MLLHAAQRAKTAKPKTNARVQKSAASEGPIPLPLSLGQHLLHRMIAHLRIRKNKNARVFFIALMGLAAIGGCNQSPTPAASGDENTPTTATTNSAPTTEPALFADVTRPLGVDFFLDPGRSRGPYFMPKSVGSGAAFLDFDNDGRLDLYFLQNGGAEARSTSRLFRQNESGNFIDVSDGSGLDIHAIGMGVAVGDIDNDSRVDVLVTEYGRTRLFANRTTGRKPSFIDITKEAGIDNVFWGSSACFTDYNRDGWLDVVVVNYVDYDPSRWCADASGRQEFCGPDNFAGRVTKLYRNNGKPGDQPQPSSLKPQVSFTDVTVPAGLAAHPGPGLGVFCADFNGDRWPDILIANDRKPNHLWINQRDGTFKEQGLVSGISVNAMGKAEANMGIGVGDVDSNGLFDVFVTHLTTETHTLWVQGPRGAFRDGTVASGVTAAWRSTGFGTVMADFDNDGAIDLSLANGGVFRPTGGRRAAVAMPQGMDRFWATYAERNQILLGDGKGRFRDVSEQNQPFSGEAAVSRGLASADFDNDGGLDLVVTRVAAPAVVYRNVAPRRGHWLLVRAIDPALNRDAYGAEIHLRAGSAKRMQWVNPGYSYLCSNDPRAHFGLGAAERYDAIEVIWPDGSAEEFPGGPTDRQITLRRGEGKAVGGTP
jgi:hypothetical protein